MGDAGQPYLIPRYVENGVVGPLGPITVTPPLFVALRIN